ncbi:MAG: DsbA family protein [Bacteroidetes bacterium]|nr:MAG: DsbA family protein [Bacteroidota bacterium]
MAKINGKAISETEKHEIIYVFDPLCGWCYGFSPVISRLKSELNSSVDFLALSGGMIKDASRIGNLAGYIKSAYKVVENATGVKFGEKFLKEVLEDDNAIFSSIPPAKAMAVIRIQKPGNCIEIATRIQKAIYYEGIDLNDINAYAEIASEFGINPDDFIRQMNSDQIERIIQDEFKMVAGMGVKSYPTVVLRKENETKIISRGYKDFESLSAIVREALH